MRYARGNTALLLAVVSVGLQAVLIALGVWWSLKPVIKHQFTKRYDPYLQYKYGYRRSALFNHYYVDISERGNQDEPVLGLPLPDMEPYRMPPWSEFDWPFLSEPMPGWISIHDQPVQETPSSRACWESIAAGWPWRSVRASWHFPQDEQKPRVMENGWSFGVGYRMAEPGASPDRGFIPSIYSPAALGASLLVPWAAMFLGFELFWLLIAIRRHKRHQCTRCGYLKDGLPPAERCPECGCGLNPSWVLRVLGG